MSLESNRSSLEDLLTRHFFIVPSFSIYGGVKGFFDFGPPGCAIKNSFLQLWRQHFILTEVMYEIETPCLTPEIVLKTSGHVDRFTDLMVRDALVPKDCYRADHLLKDRIDALVVGLPDGSRKSELLTLRARIDDLSAEELDRHLKELQVCAPETGNPITPCFPFNLMFSTPIGPSGQLKGYLRPETAQGIFVNFPRFLEYNGGKLPFAASTIGSAFRNEIAPRAGLLRVREFTMCEIEHFVDPTNKNHSKFASVRNVMLPLYPSSQQLTKDGAVFTISVGQAVDTLVISNQTLAYFLARTFLFLTKLGIPESAIRFREHLPNERAHYSEGCWDAEILTSYGWVECVGHADRACYDLTQHSRASGVKMTAFVPFETPQVETVEVILPNKGVLAKHFRAQTQAILEAIDKINEDPRAVAAFKVASQVSIPTSTTISSVVTLPAEAFMCQTLERRVNGRSFVPNVIEPSFGVGRILYALLEHSYRERPPGEDGKVRQYLSLKPQLAPIKCSLFPLRNKDEYTPLLLKLSEDLTNAGISCKVDESSTTIGRRYARTDEIGIPFAVTLDERTLAEETMADTETTVTLRERDSMAQIRIPLNAVVSTVKELIGGTRVFTA